MNCYLLYVQISIIDNCGMKNIGDLPFYAYRPACNTFEMDSEAVFICFYLAQTDSTRLCSTLVNTLELDSHANIEI